MTIPDDNCIWYKRGPKKKWNEDVRVPKLLKAVPYLCNGSGEQRISETYTWRGYRRHKTFSQGYMSGPSMEVK